MRGQSAGFKIFTWTRTSQGGTGTGKRDAWVEGLLWGQPLPQSDWGRGCPQSSVPLGCIAQVPVSAVLCASQGGSVVDRSGLGSRADPNAGSARPLRAE